MSRDEGLAICDALGLDANEINPGEPSTVTATLYVRDGAGKVIADALRKHRFTEIVETVR
jgi:hypothetical protein